MTLEKMFYRSLVFIGMATLSAGCSTLSSDPVLTSDSKLSRYHAVSGKNINSNLSGLRYTGLRDAALSTGARAALAWRSHQINQIVALYERQLDIIYNFTGMLLDDNVLPPVLLEGRQNFQQTSDEIIRVFDRAYTIQSQARFVSMAPTWREYLITNYKDPELPDASLLPRNEEEKDVWDKYIDEGWQAGITQADVIFSENLGRLTRDYEGMVLYRTLLAQNMVSPPYVAQVNLGITGGEDQMAVNDRILRITALPQFNTRGEEWKTEITADLR